MADTLGILVNTDKYLDYVVNLTRAAHLKGKEIQIFFTGKGVLLTLKPDFKELVGKAKLAIWMSASDLMNCTDVKTKFPVLVSKTLPPRQKMLKWWPIWIDIWFFK